MANSSGTCQRQFSRFRKDIWDAYNDAGLVVVVCLKLEAILSELLAQFCQAKSKDVAYYYHSEYRNKQTVKHTAADFEDENYSRIIKNRCKFTLGNLITEVFEPTNQEIKNEWGTPAHHFGLRMDEKSRLSEINDWRNAIVHYGENTNVHTILGHLTEEQRKQIICHYKFIVNESKIFETAYPNTTDNPDKTETVSMSQHGRSMAIYVISPEKTMREIANFLSSLSKDMSKLVCH